MDIGIKLLQRGNLGSCRGSNIRRRTREKYWTRLCERNQKISGYQLPPHYHKKAQKNTYVFLFTRGTYYSIVGSVYNLALALDKSTMARGTARSGLIGRTKATWLSLAPLMERRREAAAGGGGERRRNAKPKQATNKPAPTLQSDQAGSQAVPQTALTPSSSTRSALRCEGRGGGREKMNSAPETTFSFRKRNNNFSSTVGSGRVAAPRRRDETRRLYRSGLITHSFV